MLAVLAGLLMAGTAPVAQVDIQAEQPPIVVRHARLMKATQASARDTRHPTDSAPVTRLSEHPPVMRYDALRSVEPYRREGAVCAAHMELLIERVTARGGEVEAPIWQIQEYWQSQLPDPDSEAAVPSDVFDMIKQAIASSSTDSQAGYMRQLQACVTEAAAEGALDN